MEQIKRSKRQMLLKAFDKYKTNVAYGVEVEDANAHTKIVKWYQNLLDLKNSAFIVENIPARITYYLDKDYELHEYSEYVTYNENGEKTLVSEAEFKEYLKA